MSDLCEDVRAVDVNRGVICGCGGASPERGGDGAIVDLAGFCGIGERGFEWKGVSFEPI